MNKKMFNQKQIDNIYSTYSGELYIYIVRLLRSEDAAEDVLHDCFVNLIRYSAHKVIVEDTVRAFLYKTAHNLCVNYLKRESRLIKSPADESLEISYNDDFSLNIEYEELNQRIYSLLKKLDPDTRSVFVMKKENGMSVHEISSVSGLSESTVRRKLHKSTEFLAEKLRIEGLINFIFFDFF